MPSTLVTGMSAVGKSSTVEQLADRGYRAISLDSPAWSHEVPDDSEYADPATPSPADWRWREDRVGALLSAAHEDMLFIAGASTYQQRFYPLLDHMVLLTIPGEVATRRLESRTTNDYGKKPAERRRERELRALVEPLLRRSACLLVDTSVHSLSAVADIITDHVESETACATWRD